ncbi:MAG: DUF418 domain-containing protein [Deltaproteobacteria bacterium]|nr:DUF418 domain-containing protein [Deltaproteobacteria bacterium]
MSQRGARIASMDAVRGVALLGVLMVNLVTAFRVDVFEQLLPHAPPARLVDRVVASVVATGLEFKAITLFSFLFGAGLAAQRERAPHVPTFVVRRLGFLLVLGLVHLYLVWNGDILTLYALVGFACAPFLGLSPRAHLVLGASFLVIHALPLPWPAPFATVEDMERHVDFARHVYPFGNFLQVLTFRIEEVRPISRLLLWTAPRTVGLFFLGAWAWRARVLHGERPRVVRATALVGLAVGATLLALDVERHLASVALGLGYGAAILVVFERPWPARFLRAFVPIGRMALTSYLVQSVVLGFLFYGYGLGLFGRLGEAKAAAIGLTLFVVQMIVAALWQRRFGMGPVERIWRRVTWGP